MGGWIYVARKGGGKKGGGGCGGIGKKNICSIPHSIHNILYDKQVK